MAEINNSRFSASSAAATVPSDSEDEVELDPNSVELDPNSEEAKMLEATKDERRARVDAMLKKLEEEKRGPAIAREIDQALYTKAETHNADLSNEERALLLSRGDTMGKALAHPESLTAEEIYKVCMLAKLCPWVLTPTNQLPRSWDGAPLIRCISLSENGPKAL